MQNSNSSAAIEQNGMLCVVLPNLSMYKIYENGLVFSYHKKRFLKQHKNGGYIMYYLKFDDGSVKWQYAHRLVALSYIKNNEGKIWVNHKDGDKSNNHFTNLEWSTISENIKHKWDNGLQSREKMSHIMKGKKATDNAKQKMSVARKLYWQNIRGLNNA